MSNLSVGQIAGGVIGAVIGFFSGGPVGAFKGAAIGLSLGGYVDPPRGPTLRGPTLDDNTFQSATYGAFLPRLYGRIAVLGNVIYLENNRYKSKTKSQNVGGKGGGGQTVKTTTYYATFAVAMGCAYPGSQVMRMWAGGKLIVGETGPIKGLDYKYYDGTQTTPDPRMEAVLGMGNVPSYEGTAYLIFYDFELTQYGNSLAGCPIKAEFYNPGAIDRFDIEAYTLAMTVAFNSQPSPFSEPFVSLVKSSGGLPFISAYEQSTDRFFAAIGSSGTVTTDNVNDIYLGFRMHCPQSTTLGALLNWGYTFFYGEDPFYKVGVRTNTGVFTPSIFELQKFEQVCLISSGSFIYAIVHGINGGVPPSIPDNQFSVMRLGSNDTLFSFSHVSLPGNIGNFAISGDSLYHLHYSGGMSQVRFKRIRLIDGIVLYDQLIVFPPAGFFGVGNGLFGEIFDGKFYIFSCDPDASQIVLTTIDIVTFETKAKRFSVSDLQLDDQRLNTNNITVSASSIGISLIENIGFGTSYKVIVLTFTPAANENALKINVQDIVLAEAALAGIDAGSLDLSEIENDRTIGYKVGQLMSARAALGPLQGAYNFDIIEEGYQLKAIKRGKELFISMPYENMVINNDVVVSREWDSTVLMPSRVTINYIDFDREYDAGSQYADHECPYDNEMIVDMPVVMRADEAIQRADIFLKVMWAERVTYSFSAGWHSEKNLGDQIMLQYSPERLAKARIESKTKTAQGYFTYTAKGTNELAYQSNATGTSGDTGSIIVIPSYTDPVPFVLDIPMVNIIQDLYGVTAVVAQQPPTTQSALMISADGGINFDEIGRFDGPGTVGQALTEILGPGDQYVTEYDTQLLLDNVISGEFFGITHEQMMRNRNLIAYGKPGRWEILVYQNATPVGTGTNVILSTFIRGMFGTEQYMDIHEVNDFVVLLDHVNTIFAAVPQQAFGQSWPIKAINVGDSIDDGIYANYGTYMAINLKPLSVVDARATRIGNDWVIDFDPRTRYESTQWVTGANEQTDTQYYAIDILNGAAIVRTMQELTIPMTYTEAQQIADFGAIQTALVIDIYQVNQRVGRGYPMRVIA